MEYAAKLREAVYGTRFRTLYRAEAVVGLDPDFMLKAHLLVPEGHEHILYNWLLNFQYINERYSEMYANSRPYPEGDIFVFSDPDWRHPDHPLGLAFFDPLHNCAALLGLRYFGEHKKGTLTLAWGQERIHLLPRGVEALQPARGQELRHGRVRAFGLGEIHTHPC